MFIKISALALIVMLTVAEGKDPTALRSSTRNLAEIAVGGEAGEGEAGGASIPEVENVGGDNNDTASGYSYYPDEEECRGKSGSCINKNELCQVMKAATGGDTCTFFPSFMPEICPCEYEACDKGITAEDYCTYNFNRCNSDCVEYVSSCCKFPSECCKTKQGCISQAQYCDIFEAVKGDDTIASCDDFDDFADEICPCPDSTESVASYCNRIAPDCTDSCVIYVAGDESCCPTADDGTPDPDLPTGMPDDGDVVLPTPGDDGST